jgi:hypothetical protein
MSIKDYNTLGVLCALCRRHHFASGEKQKYLLEIGTRRRLVAEALLEVPQ